MSTSHFLRFCYPKGKGDVASVEKGFLRGELLVRVSVCIP